MIIHLRMTGKFFFVKEENNTSFVFSLLFKNQKNLYFYDNRGFSVVLLQKKDIFKELYPYKDIGLDVLLDEIPEQIFQEKKKMNIKVFLLDQKKISGIGNIYSSEILFAARISPFQKTSSLSLAQIRKIITETKRILADAIKCEGCSVFDYLTPEKRKGSYQNYLMVYKREGKKCYNCQQNIVGSIINRRNTFHCPNCQKLF